MLKWLFRNVCMCSDYDPESEHLLSHPANLHHSHTSPSHFPPPTTILTAPKFRPPPLADLPHQRLINRRHASAVSPLTPSPTGKGHQRDSPLVVSIVDPGHGVEGRAPSSSGTGTWSESGRERLAGIGRFYSQRMRPVVCSSLPPTPLHPTQTHTYTRHSHTSYPNTPYTPHPPIPQAHTVPTSPVHPLHHSTSTSTAPSRPLYPAGQKPEPSSSPESRPSLISRSISAPQALSLHLQSLRSAHPTLYSSGRTERAAEIEGFGAHQLPKGAKTDPRTVMIFRWRPRSATTLPAGVVRSASTTTAAGLGVGVGGLVGLQSVSDEGVHRQLLGHERSISGPATAISGQEGLEWTGRRGRSPGPSSRPDLSRRSTLSISSNAQLGLQAGSIRRTASRLGSRDLSDALEVPPITRRDGGSSREVSPDMSMEDGDVRDTVQNELGTAMYKDEEGYGGGAGSDNAVAVQNVEMGLADMFRPLGHRQSRSVGGGVGGGRTGARQGIRGKKRISTT